MRILITGAKGMLGSALYEVLRQDFEVIGIDKKECDITKKEEVETKLKDLALNVLVHCAAYTAVDEAEDEPDKVFSVNVEGTRNIVESIQAKSPLFVFISTDYIFDGTKNGEYLEDDTPCPLNIYGQSKLEAEKIVFQYKKHIIIRTSWLFGPNGKNFVNTIVDLAKQKDTIFVVKDQIGCPTYSFDLARAIKDVLALYAQERLTLGTYHLTNSGKCSWFEFAQYIVKIMELTTRIEPITSLESKRKAKRPLNSLLSNTKAVKLLGYRLRPWQEAVREYLEGYIL